ncbi:helix-turn-helix domain-containing protein [Bacillus thuringiensis]|uniref:helix-turn-helix domain-containing protein n=1 Tax=Bacillus thuringiensis TaxID=1428 RepID=UPI0015CF604E|nr:helix-turn-helix transcriptional regulator [Bacillus thuringiensis]
MKLGDKLKKIRLHCHMTQQELSKDICSQSFLSKIENNLEIPNAQILFYLCQKLGVPVEQVVMEPGGIIQKKMLYRKQVESLIKKSNYKGALNLLKEKNFLLDYSNEYDYQFYHYYIGICFYHLNTSLVEAERNFKMACKRASSIPYLNVTPLSILITNALAIIEIEKKQNRKHGLSLLEKSYSQIPQLFEYSRSDMHSKVFYNLSKCYCLEKKYELAIKVAKEGINWTSQFSTTYFLSELYYQKGIAEMALDQKSIAKQSLLLSAAIAKGQNNTYLYNKIIESELEKDLKKELCPFFQMLADK